MAGCAGFAPPSLQYANVLAESPRQRPNLAPQARNLAAQRPNLAPQARNLAASAAQPRAAGAQPRRVSGYRRFQTAYSFTVRPSAERFLTACPFLYAIFGIVASGSRIAQPAKTYPLRVNLLAQSFCALP